MTEPIKDGGPDHPFGQTDFETGRLVNGWGSEGMSMRDAFAISALTSGQASNWRDNEYSPVNGLSIIENTARHAYEIADAMLRARSQGEQE